ncbi:MAG: protein BatD [Verrucomicrobia bacterium]|nr:protein BatD [Verrucomicrobiota bacterium]
MFKFLLFTKVDGLFPKHSKRQRLPALAMLILLFTPVAVHAAKFTATLDRDTTRVGESVTLSLNFEEGSPKAAPNLPPLPNLNVTSVGESSQYTIANGQTTASRSFNFSLTPTQPGNITIPALRIEVDGKILTSQPLTLRVLKNEAPANPDATLTNLAFVRLVVPKNEVYLGEPFPVEIQLYYQNVQNVRMPQLHAEGFSLGKSTEPTQTRTQVGNFIYNLVVFKMSATAAKAGTLTLGPVECSLTVLVPMNNQRQRDLFGFFGNNMQAYPTTLVSEPQTMRVLPLPTEKVPDNFNGAVGEFALSVSAGPTNVAVGDPITLKVQITGRGAMDALSLPDQPQWREFKIYPPTSTVTNRDPLGLSGVKTFEQVLIPQNHEIKFLPPLEFSFFDPNRKSYRTLTNAGIPLIVGYAASTSAQPSILASAAPAASPPTSDIVHIKARMDTLGLVSAPLVQQTWFLTLQSVPVLVWLSLLVMRKRNEALANNPKLRRQREVARRIQTGLQELHNQANAQQSEDFFATLFRLLQEQLGERLDLPASAITEAVIDERLRGRTVPEQTLTELHELFQTCNQARYAPQKTSRELASLVPRVESILRELQSLKQ